MPDKKYSDCEHQWSFINRKLHAEVLCTECHLSVELYRNHLSIWDYNLPGTKIIGIINYDK